MAQWLKHLPCKHKDWGLDPQSPNKCPVGTAACLKFWHGKVEMGSLEKVGQRLRFLFSELWLRARVVPNMCFCLNMHEYMCAEHYNTSTQLCILIYKRWKKWSSFFKIPDLGMMA